MYQFIFFTDVTDTIFVTKVIGAYKCASVLRDAGYSCLVVDHFHTYTQHELAELIAKVVGPTTLAVGFSTTFFLDTVDSTAENGYVTFRPLSDLSFFPQGIEVENTTVEFIRSVNANTKIMVGGSKSLHYKDNINVDYCLVGFSESSIVDLARQLSTSIPNASAGTVIIDDRYASKHDFKNTAFKWEPEDVVNAVVLPLEISRGCIFKCTFCSYPLNGKKSIDFVKSVDLIFTELQTNYDRFGTTVYNIVDDTFNDNEVKLNLIHSAVKKLSFVPIFWAYLRLDLIYSKQHFAKLYDIGIRACYFGIETLNHQTGKAIGKGLDPKKQIQTIQQIRRDYPDVVMHGSFIIGLPHEDVDTITATFEQVLANTIPLHSFDFKALFIENAAESAWTSEFSRSYKKYGYEITNSSNGYLEWKNEIMTINEARNLAQVFRERAHNSNRLRNSGQSIWSLLNYNFSYEFLRELTHDNTPWHDFSLAKEKYVNAYKCQLNEIISKHN